MKKIYIACTLLAIIFGVNAQNMNYSLSHIGTNANGNLEMALVATPDFTETNGNSSDMGAVVSIAGGAYLLPGNTGFVNNCVFTPPASNVCDYAIPATEWDATYLAGPSASSGNFVYQLLRTPGATNVFFDAESGTPIIMAVFQVTTGSGAPTTGSISIIDNSDALISSEPNENFLNINYPTATSGSTQDILGTVDTTPFSFAALSTSDVSLNLNEAVLSPNPTKGSFVVEGLKTAASVSMYSVNGKKILSIDNYQGESINTSNVSSGLYLVSIESEGSKEVRRLMIN
ncbi:T9SS type A sorting domain-containing protein [Pseudofulvibacter geojedonensis]|uniref:T9SS type A sorting domain-containing protein n=1 Tax=Pseudofulvibacter geojedonensis TaxID=1123758 RepID=A0ABW3HZ76_9FLAO